MQIRERNEEGMGRGRKKHRLSFSPRPRFSRLVAHHSPLVRSRDVRSIALNTLGKERDCSQSKKKPTQRRIVFFKVYYISAVQTSLLASVCRDENCILIILHLTALASSALVMQISGGSTPLAKEGPRALLLLLLLLFLLILPTFLPSAIF